MADTRRLPAPVTSVWDWQLRAACRNLDNAVFFHADGERGPARRDRDDRAKRVCRACPVIRECRQHALTSGEHYGVWGGLSEDDRRGTRTRPGFAAALGAADDAGRDDRHY